MDKYWALLFLRTTPKPDSPSQWRGFEHRAQNEHEGLGFAFL